MSILKIATLNASNITTEAFAKEIYGKIKVEIQNGPLTVDFEGITTMTTICARLIFGRLYQELGQDGFYKNIIIKSASPPLQIVIEESILSHLEAAQKEQ